MRTRSRHPHTGHGQWMRVGPDIWLVFPSPRSCRTRSVGSSACTPSHAAAGRRPSTYRAVYVSGAGGRKSGKVS